MLPSRRGASERLLPLALAVASLLVVNGATASATTMVRLGLKELTTSNEMIVVGEVVNKRSYWNEDSSYILTDFEIALDEVLKGRRPGDRLEITLMGGVVGDIAVVAVGEASLMPGASYVLFLSRQDLPGAPAALTVGDLGQGTFDIKAHRAGLRAVSQAGNVRLLADRGGATEPPGGAAGFEFGELLRLIRVLVDANPEEVDR